MAGIESSALDALLDQFVAEGVEEPLQSSAGSASSTSSRVSHKSKSRKGKKKTKKKKKGKKDSNGEGASWMPWGADGVAKSLDGDESDDDQESIDSDDDLCYHTPHAGHPGAADSLAIGGFDSQGCGCADATGGTQDAPVPADGRGTGILSSIDTPSGVLVTSGAVNGAMATPIELPPPPPSLAQPSRDPSVSRGAPPVKLHPSTIAAMPPHPLGLAPSGLAAPPPLVLSPPPLLPDALEQNCAQQSSEFRITASLGDSAGSSDAVVPAQADETVALGEKRVGLNIAGLAKSQSAVSVSSTTPVGKRAMLLSGGLSGPIKTPETSSADSSEEQPKGAGVKKLLRSISRKSLKSNRPERSSSETPAAQPERSRTDWRDRRRTLNLGSPRDEMTAEKKPKRRGMVRSLSAKGMNLVVKRKESFVNLSPFLNLDSNELCWSDVQPSNATNETMSEHLRSFVCDLDNFNYECGCLEATSFQRKTVIEQQHIDVKFFEEYFENGKYETYVARNVDRPWVMAIAKVKSLKKTLVYINNGETAYRLSTDYGSKPKDILMQVPRYSSKLADAQFELVRGCTTYSDILRLEQFDHRPQYTIGVLYCAEGQTTEMEMYNNEHGSPEFDEFLSMLGDRVELKGWPRYAGGLDVNRNKTGTHSIYTMLRQYEVMYHVSTMLPYEKSDDQKIERKRHIGNDMVVVIFKEGSQKINPMCFDSQFNFIFVVVERVPASECCEGGIVYNVEFCYRKRSPAPARPALPSPAFLKAGSRSRDLLVTKLMNAERMSLCADDFQEKLKRTKRHMIDFMVERYFRS